MSRSRHTPAALRHVVSRRGRIVIRRPERGDGEALGRLVGLAERTVPAAPLLLAEADGELVAALSTATGEVVADPFVATGDVVALLRVRAAQLDSAA